MSFDTSALLSLLSSAPPASAGQPWILWAIAFGIVVVTVAFAFFGRMALKDSGPRKVASESFFSEIDLKPIKDDAALAEDQRAFVSLARKLKLNRSQRILIRRVAQVSRTPTPAMLLSEQAYDSAIEFVIRDREIPSGSAERREFVRLRSRLFAE